MSTRRLPLLLITVAAMLATAGQSSAMTIEYDLAGDWSDAQNPFGPWSLKKSPTALFQSVQPDYWSNGTNQHAWADEPYPQWAQAPFWLRTILQQPLPVYLGVQIGDVLAHGAEIQRTGTDVTSAVWTAPYCGSVVISGAVWSVTAFYRTMGWELRKNGVTFSSGTIVSDGTYTRYQPFEFGAGSGGGSVLQQAVAAGDQIELLLRTLSVSGVSDPLGIRFRIVVDPWAANVQDVPGDQGGEIEVFWTQHSLDMASVPNPVVDYAVQRLDAVWETLTTVVATQSVSYSVVVTTPDILAVGEPEPFSRYRVVARTETPVGLYPSVADSGYSIDNLAPPTPELTIYDSESSRLLIWQNPDIPDFKETCVYRATEPGFIPGDPLACTTETYFIETHLNRFWYKIRLYDIHNNPSEFSNEVVGQYPTDVPGAVPTELRLYPNAPNPFNPTTTLRFDVPIGGRVRLAVYDVAGRLVRVLVAEELPAGAHQAVWDGRNSAERAMASGSYFARMEAGGKVETIRLSLVR